jgi:hypothetical protein
MLGVRASNLVSLHCSSGIQNSQVANHVLAIHL